MATAAPEHDIERLVQQIEATRGGLRRHRRVLGAIATALAALGLAGFWAGADFVWELDLRLRAVALAVAVAAVALLTARLVARPRRELRRTDAAAEIEDGFPALGQRVRTTLEYAEPTPATAPAAPGLVTALTADTDRRTRPLDLPGVVPWRTLRAPAGALGLAVAAAMMMLVREPEARIALARVFLLPAAYTQLDVRPGDQTLKAGAEFTLETRIAGRAVRHAEWRRRPAASAGAWTTVSLAPRGSAQGEVGTPVAFRGTLHDTIKNCEQNFDYQVIAGSIASPTYRVNVLHPLVIQGVEAVVEPPAYTRRPAVTEKTGDFKVVEGSATRLRLTLDRPPTTAQVAFTDSADRARATETYPVAIHGNVLEVSFPRLDRSLEYTATARAADGMTLEPHTYMIRVQPDEKPAIGFLRPAEELAVIATTEVPIEVEATDDFGVGQVGIAYQIDGGPWETLLLDKPKGLPVKASELATLYLEKHPLTFTSALAYSAFVEDNYPGTPHRTSTELRYIDILPFKQAYQLSEGQCNCQGQSTTLEELIHRQRANLSRTFALAQDPSASADAGARLAKAERELAALTTEFTAALEARFGQVSVLHLAVAAMEAAVSDLERAQWKPAVTDQEMALSSLIKARQNLRKLLKDSASASECRKFDRQQQQKIRRPPSKKPAPEMARQLKKLAETERSVCQGLCPNPGRSQAGAQSSEKLADRQEDATRHAEELRSAMRADEAMTALARERMNQAARTVAQSRDALRARKPSQAGERAGDAADQLERLAEQVAGLTARDVAARLGQAEQLAKALAAEQGKPGAAAAARQAALAEQAKTLADWLKRLPADAAEESRELSQALAKAVRENPPDEIAAAMQSASDGLRSSGGKPPADQTQDAARRLNALAQDLEDARRAFVQPQLDALVAAEAAAAKTERLLKSAHDNGEKAAAERAVSDLVERLRKLRARSGDGQDGLRKATDALADSQTRRGGGWGDFQRPPREGPNENRPVLVPPGEYTRAVRRVITALQAQIQDIVLKQVLLDKDEPVPPQYRTLVDDYYRTLSEDLR